MENTYKVVFTVFNTNADPQTFTFDIKAPCAAAARTYADCTIFMNLYNRVPIPHYQIDSIELA